MKKLEITKEIEDYCLKQFRYDKDTGLLYNRHGHQVGQKHTKGNSYMRVKLYCKSFGDKGRYLFLHQIAWFLHHRKFPDDQIDFINGDRSDCRLVNMRQADNSKNQANRGLSRRNTSGYKGVSWDKNLGKWRVAIACNGHKYFLGYYDDPKDGADAYDRKAIELFDEYARTNADMRCLTS